MFNQNNKKTKQKTSLDEQIKVAHQIIWAISAFLIFVAVSGYITPKARVPKEPTPPVIQAQQEDYRHLIALAQGNSEVFLGWRLFGSDPKEPPIGFRVYRSENSGGPYNDCLNCGEGEEIIDSTNFLDIVPQGGNYYYIVRTYDGSEEGADSNEAQVNAVEGELTNPNPEKYRWLNVSVPTSTEGAGPSVGDLDGDGLLDYVIKDRNGVGWEDPEATIILKAYKHDGTHLWDFDTGYYFRQWYIDPPGNWYDEKVSVPWAVWDIDNDGKAEVIVRTDNGPGEPPDEINQTYLMIIKGGDPQATTRLEIPYPTNEALQLEKHWDPEKERERWVNLPYYLSIAHLDGVDNPAQIIVQVAVHDGERLIAYNVNPETFELTQRWDFQSTTGYDEDLNRIVTEGTGGSGTHGIAVYDMDHDGKDEVFDGSTLLDGDDSDNDGAPEVIWTAYRENGTSRLFHPDAVIPGDILPDHEGLEVWFVTEGRPQGVYLVDEDGLVIWEDTSGGHTHDGWVANLINDTELTGHELYAWDTGSDTVEMFASENGDIIYNDFSAGLNQNTYHSVIQWDEDSETELFTSLPDEGRMIKNARLQGDDLIFDNGPNINIYPSWYGLRADILGDFREEFIFSGGGNTRLQIYTNTEIITSREVTRWENLEYRKTAARIGGSYWKYFGPIDFSQELSDLTIDIETTTPVISPGENLELDITVTNNSDSPLQAQYWLYLVEAGQTPSGGPNDGPIDIILEAGAIGNYHRSILITTNTTPGYYQAVARVGDAYPDYLDEDWADYLVTSIIVHRAEPYYTGLEDLYIQLGAETASPLINPMQIGDNDNAIGGQYIGVPYNSDTTPCGGVEGPEIACGGLASYSFTIPPGQAGQYVIWGRELSPQSDRDSFWVRMDEGEDILWETELSASWIWDQVSQRQGTDPYIFTLTSGDHTLRISGRDDGTGLDHILITNDLTLGQ